MSISPAIYTYTDFYIDDMDKKLLLTIQWVCNRRKITIPWDLVGAEMGATISAGAVIQHLSKLRQKMVAEGLPVPPPLARGGGGGRSGLTESAAPHDKNPRAATSSARRTRHSLSIGTPTAEDKNDADKSSESDYGKSNAKSKKRTKKTVKQEAISGDDRLSFDESSKKRKRGGPSTTANKKDSESFVSSDTSADENKDIRYGVGDEMWDLDTDSDPVIDNDDSCTPKNSQPAVKSPATPKKRSSKAKTFENDSSDSDGKLPRTPIKSSSESSAKVPKAPKKRSFKTFSSAQAQQNLTTPKTNKRSSTEESTKPQSKIVKLKWGQKSGANAGKDVQSMKKTNDYDDDYADASSVGATGEVAGYSIANFDNTIPEGYQLYTQAELPTLEASESGLPDLKGQDDTLELVDASARLYHNLNFDGGLFDEMNTSRDSIQYANFQSPYNGYPENSYAINRGNNLTDMSGSHSGQTGLNAQSFRGSFPDTNIAGSTAGPMNNPNVLAEHYHMQPRTGYINQDNTHWDGGDWTNSGAYGSGFFGGHGGGYGGEQGGGFDEEFGVQFDEGGFGDY